MNHTPPSRGPDDVLAELCRAEIARSGSATFVTRGSSMRPLIRPGDTLHLAAVRAADVRRADILAFAREGRLVAHRVLRVLAGSGNEPEFLLKGDASLRADGVVTAADVVGRVVARSRGGGVRSLERGTLGWCGRALALVSPATRWIVPPLRRLRRKKQRLLD